MPIRIYVAIVDLGHCRECGILTDVREGLCAKHAPPEYAARLVREMAEADVCVDLSDPDFQEWTDREIANLLRKKFGDYVRTDSNPRGRLN